jgi:hypothetical protein
MIDPMMFWLAMGVMMTAGLIVGATGALILVLRSGSWAQH